MLDFHFQHKQAKLYALFKATGPCVATTIGGGGAKGGAKSAGARNCSLRLACELGEEYPGVTITIVRRVYDDLKKNHIDELFAAYPGLRQYYSQDNKELTLAHGARIVFAFAETAGDVERKFRGGYQSPFIIVDEAQQFTEAELHDFKMATRWTQRSTGIPDGFCKLMLLFNPGGRSADYLRRIFWTREYHGAEKPSDFDFVHMFGWDNYEWFRGQVKIGEQEFYKLPSAVRFRLFTENTQYGRDMNAMPESVRKGYLLGSFDQFEGQYFAGAWDREKCVLTPKIVEHIIQPWWVRWMAQDWAFAEHSSHGWYAAGKVSPSDWVQLFGGECQYSMDIVIRYREHVISNRAEADMATDIVARTPMEERPYISRFFLSEDAFGQRAKQGSGHTLGEAYSNILSRYGLPRPETADQNRLMGWRFMYNALRQANLRGTNISEERSKQGAAFFVSEECPRAISCIPMAIRDDDDPDDVARVAGAMWEDVTDEIRYGLHSMLNPKSKAPREVRAKELYHSIQGPDPETVMTERAMAMRQFQQREATTTRVSRAQRWRE